MIPIEVVWYRRRVCHYEISVGATIMELSNKIEEDAGIGLAVEEQEFEFNGDAMEDHLNLEDYQIPSHATLSLFTKIRLWVVREGASYPFDAHNGMKVRDLINQMILHRVVACSVHKSWLN